MVELKACFTIVLMGICSLSFAQAPNWVVDANDFGQDMTVIVKISDECVPSDVPNDIVAAFDINGQIRGVANTNINNAAFLAIGAENPGEVIYFKVYDASTDAVYNIYNTTVAFEVDGDIGDFDDPFLLILITRF